jgi:fructosamine-3-kinase
MSMSLTDRVAELVGSPVASSSPVSGGDINDAVRAELGDGRVVFAKGQRPGAEPAPGLFAIEADGLRRLGAATGGVRVPAVVAVADDALVLEWIEPGRRGRDFDRTLGTQLAALHRTTNPTFGLEHAGPIPPSLLLAHDDTPSDSWPEFYATRRIEPLVRYTVDRGRLPEGAGDAFAGLVDRLPELCGPPEPPALLHGDLWSGNSLSDDGGDPVLVDPHAHFGHREIDLAMMRLFGGFDPRTFAAYDDVFPLAAGHLDRVPLYQLHPLLNHVALFGGGYASATMAAVAHYL